MHAAINLVSLTAFIALKDCRLMNEKAIPSGMLTVVGITVAVGVVAALVVVKEDMGDMAMGPILAVARLSVAVPLTW